MTIAVKFFASLREQVGIAETTLDSQAVSSVSDVWKLASEGQAMPANTLMAVNMDYVDATHTVVAGYEVAFFPPVTGG
ncbi:MAG: MoaD/ThiS family protein [Halobacteria archaeon]|nr:MoaD/ThiS family protein [Halobacteria archaeon]